MSIAVFACTAISILVQIGCYLGAIWVLERRLDHELAPPRRPLPPEVLRVLTEAGVVIPLPSATFALRISPSELNKAAG
ncbi:hypothetical protein OHA40_15185 [Nocardia sp. NBC_00508]|uniref:hypothetical protein n=1 Tax=Nocardia sp. NBC_00508 TaxID=2975992 RepID=UPI002E8234C8|nr:hypothetical protein [Nocardia sp. NBC_00508]WUD69348.1 hypothetical protein OHA40_15185 [Nocardia sp. NBC_00508]